MGKTLADVFDSYVNWIVLFVFLTAVNLAMEAGAYLVNDAAGGALRAWALWPARAAGLAVIVAVAVWLRLPKHKRQKRDQRALLDGYVMDAIKRSAFIAFVLTFILVAFLDVAANHTRLPADFFVKLTGLSLSAAFSVSFFLSNFFNGENSPEDR